MDYSMSGLFLRLLSYLLFLCSSNNIMAVGSGWESDKVFCRNPLVCQQGAFKNFLRQARKSFFETWGLEVRQLDAMRPTGLRALVNIEDDKHPEFFEKDKNNLTFYCPPCKGVQGPWVCQIRILFFAFSLKSRRGRNIWTDVRCSLWQQFPDPDNNAKLLHSTSQFAFQIPHFITALTKY